MEGKKWAYFNLNRLYIRSVSLAPGLQNEPAAASPSFPLSPFSPGLAARCPRQVLSLTRAPPHPPPFRHGNTENITKDAAVMIRFAREFSTNIAPEILKHYLQQIEKWVAKTAPLTRPCLSYTIVFLDECIRPKDMWAHLKPAPQQPGHPPDLPHPLYDRGRPGALRRRPRGVPASQAQPLRGGVGPGRVGHQLPRDPDQGPPKQTFEILQFINGIVNEYEQSPDDKKNHVAKEGALRMIGTLAPVILGKKSPIADQVEYFLVRYVFPDFTSPQGFPARPRLRHGREVRAAQLPRAGQPADRLPPHPRLHGRPGPARARDRRPGPAAAHTTRP